MHSLTPEQKRSIINSPGAFWHRDRLTFFIFLPGRQDTGKIHFKYVKKHFVGQCLYTWLQILHPPPPPMIGMPELREYTIWAVASTSFSNN